MARPMPPVSPYVPWPCSGTSTPTELALAAMTRLVALRFTTLTASSTIPTGSTTCSSPPPWEVINYEPRNPIESDTFMWVTHEHNSCSSPYSLLQAWQTHGEEESFLLKFPHDSTEKERRNM